MSISRIFAVIVMLLVILGGCKEMKEKQDIKSEMALVEEVIKNSIGWAANKDKELVFSCFADDEELFYFSPRDDGTIYGRKAFVQLTEGFFMLDDFKAIGFEIKDLKINLSRSGEVAWYHARLDDFNEWKGQPANWEDVRWTGVLEKRDGKWVIVQMHFSEATDKVKS
jgi:ketosteroid isomerase-like protein